MGESIMSAFQRLEAAVAEVHERVINRSPSSTRSTDSCVLGEIAQIKTEMKEIRKTEKAIFNELQEIRELLTRRNPRTRHRDELEDFYADDERHTPVDTEPIYESILGEWKLEFENGTRAVCSGYVKYKRQGNTILEYEKENVPDYGKPIEMNIPAYLEQNHLRTPADPNLQMQRFIDRFMKRGKLHVIRQLGISNQYCIYRRIAF